MTAAVADAPHGRENRSCSATKSRGVVVDLPGYSSSRCASARPTSRRQLVRVDEAQHDRGERHVVERRAEVTDRGGALDGTRRGGASQVGEPGRGEDVGDVAAAGGDLGRRDVAEHRPGDVQVGDRLREQRAAAGGGDVTDSTRPSAVASSRTPRRTLARMVSLGSMGGQPSIGRPAVSTHQPFGAAMSPQVTPCSSSAIQGMSPSGEPSSANATDSEPVP